MRKKAVLNKEKKPMLQVFRRLIGEECFAKAIF